MVTKFVGLNLLFWNSWFAYTVGCETPQSAVYSLFHFLDDDNDDAARAAQCFASGVEAPGVLAQKLRSTLDARDIFVDLDKLSSDPEFKNSRGEAKQVLDPRIAEVYVERVAGQWVFPEKVLARVPELFRAAVLVDLGSFVEWLPQWSRRQVLGVAIYKLLGLVVLLLLAVVARFVVAAIVMSQLRQRRVTSGPRMDWGTKLVDKVAKPLGTLVGAGVVAAAVPSLVLPIRMGQIVLFATEVVAVFSAVWVLYRCVDLVAAWMGQRAALTETKLDDQLVPLVRKALKIFIVAMGSVFILQNLDVDVGGLLAGLGLGGLAFALAAKDTIANIFGSATIFADRPFQVGDWINALGVDGTVEVVGFRSTKIRTFYDSLVSIPNAKLADAVIDNYGARSYRRVYTRLGVTYDTPVEHLQAFVEGIRAVIRANGFTRKDKYEIHFNDYGASALELMVYFFLGVSSWSEELRERHHILLEIHRLAETLGISFAFPTQTLHVESMARPGESPVTKRPASSELAAKIEAFGPEGDRARPKGLKIASGYWPDGA